MKINPIQSSVGTAKPRILLILLDFPSWRQGRSLSYPVQMGMEESLRGKSVDLVTIPMLTDMPTSGPASWLAHARKLYDKQKFDQVWIELVHISYDADYLDWIATLAPVRVGFVLESLQYDPQVYQEAPHLKKRKDDVTRRMAHMTHVVVVDEQDVLDLNQAGMVKAMWWPQTIPVASIAAAPPVTNQYAVFYGAIYGQRQNWLDHPALAQLLVQPGPSLEHQTRYPEFFEFLQGTTIDALANGSNMTQELMDEYLAILRHLRQQIFSLWLRSLQQGCAVVNLPSFFQGFPGRIFEGMAAARPVISCTIPNRPRTNALFTDGEDILLYDPNSPEQLAEKIRSVQNDSVLAQTLVRNAHRKIQKLHTTEKRVQQILDWIATGIETDFNAP